LQIEVFDAKSNKSLGKLTDVRCWISYSLRCYRKFPNRKFEIMI